MINQVNIDEAITIWEHAYQQNSIHAPFLTRAWHKTWFHSLGSAYTPLILNIDNALLAPFAQKGTQILFSGGDEIADYIDIIGPDKLKISAWQQIFSFLQSLHIEKISLRNIPQNSSTKLFFETQKNTVIEKEDPTPLFSLPATWETFVESLSKKYRHELERKIRKFEREHPTAKIIQSNNPTQEIQLLFQLMEQDEEKKLFLTNEMKMFFMKLTETFSQEIQLLYISQNNECIAATLSFIHDKTSYLYNSGFNKEKYANAGFYLKSMTIKQAIEQKLLQYNFLQGNERYKYELGGQDFSVYSVTCSL
jgi:hypothetical protein